MSSSKQVLSHAPCPSWTRLHGHDYACSLSAKTEHDECVALVRGDNGQDVIVKWVKR